MVCTKFDPVENHRFCHAFHAFSKCSFIAFLLTVLGKLQGAMVFTTMDTMEKNWWGPKRMPLSFFVCVGTSIGIEARQLLWGHAWIECEMQPVRWAAVQHVVLLGNSSRTFEGRYGINSLCQESEAFLCLAACQHLRYIKEVGSTWSDSMCNYVSYPLR